MQASDLPVLQVSVDAASILRERNELAVRIQHLEAQSSAALPLSNSVAEGDASAADFPVGKERQGDARSIALLRKLADKQGEIQRLKVCRAIHSASFWSIANPTCRNLKTRSTLLLSHDMRLFSLQVLPCTLQHLLIGPYCPSAISRRKLWHD